MDQALNNFCLNTFILGGKRLYEIFHANFKGVIPSPRTMGERLAKHQTFIQMVISIAWFFEEHC